MADSWLARKLAERTQMQQQQPAPAPVLGQAGAIAAPFNDFLRRQMGMPPRGQPPQPNGLPPAVPLERQLQPLPPRRPGEQPPIKVKIQDGTEVLNAFEWRGDRRNGYYKAPETCPQCGSTNYFSRRGSKMTKNGSVPAAPHCYDCGFNPNFTPYGGTMDAGGAIVDTR